MSARVNRRPRVVIEDGVSAPAAAAIECPGCHRRLGNEISSPDMAGKPPKGGEIGVCTCGAIFVWDSPSTFHLATDADRERVERDYPGLLSQVEQVISRTRLGAELLTGPEQLRRDGFAS
jgi:hypothetical protein